MLQCWALQFGASLADKVESSRILGYVVHCLSSIVVNEYTCIMGSRAYTCMIYSKLGTREVNNYT